MLQRLGVVDADLLRDERRYHVLGPGDDIRQGNRPQDELLRTANLPNEDCRRIEVAGERPKIGRVARRTAPAGVSGVGDPGFEPGTSALLELPERFRSPSKSPANRAECRLTTGIAAPSESTAYDRIAPLETAPGACGNGRGLRPRRRCGALVQACRSAETPGIPPVPWIRAENGSYKTALRVSNRIRTRPAERDRRWKTLDAC